MASASAKDEGDGESNCWPTIAASLIRAKAQDGTGSYCRLFLNGSTGEIELVPSDDDDANSQTEVYDDSDADVERDPSYRSYLRTAHDERRVVEDCFHPNDVIGANLSLEHDARDRASAKLNIYTYPRMGKRREARHKCYTLDPRCCNDFRRARLLVRSIQKLSKLRNIESPAKCLVVLNPFSGGGGAKSAYQTMVKPMLEQAGLDHVALMTRRRGHARERMCARPPAGAGEDAAGGEAAANDGGSAAEDAANTDSELEDISGFGAIIAVGGDGILFEILQGVRARPDGDSIMSGMKFGIVPCGTYNGLASSVLHWSGAEYDRVESIFLVCRGHTAPLDVATYQVLCEANPEPYASFLSFTWGLIADCDYESECLRWLGHARSDVWGVYRGILFRKRYRARFSYLPPNSDVVGGDGIAEVVMPKLGRPLPEGWLLVEDDFLVFWVCNTSHAGHKMFTCPPSKMNDGLFHVLLVRSSCSRLRFLHMLLQLGSGSHIGNEEMEVIQCVAFQLEPLSDVSYNILDGELLEKGPIQACLMSSQIQFFAGEMAGRD